MDAETRDCGGTDELTTDEVKGLLDEIASRSNETMVVLTGGEPLLRRDLDELVGHGSKLGLSIVVGTNGVLLDEQRVTSLKEAGAMGMGISLDSLDPTSHDNFRGCPGSWEKTLAGMEACRKQGLPFLHQGHRRSCAKHLLPNLHWPRRVHVRHHTSPLRRSAGTAS